MNAKNKLATISIAVVLAVSLLLGSAYTGARIERSKYERIIDRIAREHTESVASLRSSLAESESRIESIGTGLGRAVDTASKLADRSARIKALIFGIDEAIKIIRGSE